MIGDRSYDGDPLDWSWQYIGERPELDEEAEDVAYATDPDEAGEERTVGEPVVDPNERKEHDESESAQDSNSRCRDRVRGSDSRPRNGRGSNGRREVGDPGEQADLSDFGGGGA